MSNDKMRAEFEASYRNEALNGPCGKGTFDEAAFSMRDGRYIIGMAQAAWWAWQASRAALVVELPTAMDGPDGDGLDGDYEEFEMHEAVAGEVSCMRAKCRAAIEAAGVKIKE